MRPLLALLAAGLLSGGCGGPAEPTAADTATKASDPNRPVSSDPSILKGEK